MNGELEKLRIELPSLIKRKGKADSARAIYDVLRGLKDVVPVLKIRGSIYPISQSTLTSAPVFVPQTDLSAPPLGAFDSAMYEGFALIPLPRKPFVIMIPNTAICVRVVLMKKEEDETGHYLSLAGTDIPCMLNFTLLKGGKGGGFEINLDENRADVVDIKNFEDLLRAYDAHKSLLVKDLEGNVVMGCDGIKLARPLSSDQWYKAISNLAYIEERTSHRIPAPKDFRISSADIETAARIRNILERGKETLSIQALTLTIGKEQIEKLIEIQKNLKKIPELILHHERYAVSLLGEEILLGPVTWQLPDMVLREPLEEFVGRIRDIEPKAPVEVAMLPYSNREVRITYEKWKK